MNTKKIEITINKTKLLLFLIFSIVLFFGSIMVFFNKSESYFSFFNSSSTMKSISLIGMIMALFFSYFLIKKILDKNIGFTVDEIGVIDNTTSFSVGRIPWDDISEVKIEKIRVSLFSNYKSIFIIIKNPNDYILKQSKPFVKTILQSNMQQFGTPIIISTKSLKISVEELNEILQKKAREQKVKLL